MILLHVCKNPALSAIPNRVALAQIIICLDAHTAHLCFVLRRLTTVVIKFVVTHYAPIGLRTFIS